MRAMILAAGLGTRMGSLAPLSAKPALPVRGVSLVGMILRLLARSGVVEAIVNTHYRSDTLRRAIEEDTPAGLAVVVSEENQPLGTGGGIRKAADFLRESDPCLVLAGDMLLDADLRALVALHRAHGDFVTLGLREDSRAEIFGTIACDEAGRIRKIGSRFEFGSWTRAREGVFVSPRVIAANAFDTLPDLEVFEDLSDWLAPLLANGAADIRGEVLDCEWQPVGTPGEYLDANLSPISLSYMDLDALAKKRGVELANGCVIGPNAVLEEDVILDRSVVWRNERVPKGLRARNGIFAGGRFHPCTSGIQDS